MKAVFLSAAVVMLALVAGCDKKAQVVGNWKVEPAPTTGNNPGDVMRGSMMNLRTQNMKVEFTSDNKVRFTNFQGESTGTYELKGDEVTIKFNTFSPFSELKMKLEGGKLREVTDFKSDVALTLIKE
jgi:uncharacterized lipoprotein NlpE involved in copper resistance